MDKALLKQTIIDANNAYRSGNSIMPDSDYDALVEKFQTSFPDEYDDFRDSLNEGAIEYGSKVKHPFVMGSLNKVTIEKPDDIFKFIKKHVTKSLNVSAKVDGISCRLHYENKKLVQASTRGDGMQGIDISDKIKHVKNVPPSIKLDGNVDIRGELVIFTDDFSNMSGFANPRNATAGIINRKDWNKNDVCNVSFVAYTILGDAYSKSEQFALLKDNSFYTAWNIDYASDEFSKPGFIDVLTESIVKEHEYETDGLVLSDSSYKNETKYRPDAAVAVKGNMTYATTRVIDVEWRGPSKDGKFVPVAQLDPVELCGTVVSQATLNNLDFIAKMNVKYGSVVKVQKRGEIIPAIISVDDNANAIDIEPIHECPCCGSRLEDDGLFYWCTNKQCQDQMNHQLSYFIKKLEVKSISGATLKNFGIQNYADLIAFVPNKKYKQQVKLYDELIAKVFTRSKQELLAAMNFKDVGETLINKIVDFYGFDNIEAGVYTGLPVGIGEITLEKFKNAVQDNLNIVNMFINDSRYNYSKNGQECSEGDSCKTNGMSICFTGHLDTMSRSEATKKAEAAGFVVKNGVAKGLTYLVTNDTESGSSKNRKAKQLNVKVIDEQQFLKLVNNEVQDDICDL